MGFFLQMQGQFGTFLYTDPTDSAATNVTFATGDGVTTTFTFSRFMGAFLEPVGWVTSVSNVFLNSVNQPSGWALSAPNSLVFASAPGSGVSIAATFTYAFECRFDSDDQDFEEFMSNLWQSRQYQIQIGEDVVTLRSAVEALRANLSSSMRIRR